MDVGVADRRPTSWLRIQILKGFGLIFKHLTWRFEHLSKNCYVNEMESDCKERLMGDIREQRNSYDMSMREYKSIQRTKNTWQEIAQTLGKHCGIVGNTGICHKKCIHLVHSTLKLQLSGKCVCVESVQLMQYTQYAGVCGYFYSGKLKKENVVCQYNKGDMLKIVFHCTQSMLAILGKSS